MSISSTGDDAYPFFGDCEAATLTLGFREKAARRWFVLFTLQIPEEMSQGRNSYTEQDLRPLSLEELRGSSSTMEPSDYHCYLQDCMDDLLKEMKEKFKGWVSCSTSEQADLAYKKVCTLTCSTTLLFSASSLIQASFWYRYNSSVHTFILWIDLRKNNNLLTQLHTI